MATLRALGRCAKRRARQSEKHPYFARAANPRRYAIATAIDLGLPAQPPLAYLGFMEPTCKYEAYGIPGPSGFSTVSAAAAPAKCSNGCVISNGNACNNTRNVVDPVARTLTLYIYGGDDVDPECKGPIYSSFVAAPSKDTTGTNPTGVNTMYSGTCSGPTTGLNNFNSGNYPGDPHPGIVAVRVFEAPPWLMQAPSRVSSQVIGGGVKMNLFLDENCMWPTGGAEGAASLTIFGGYCNNGFAIVTCNAAQGYASVAAWENNDCDAEPWAVAYLMTTQCVNFNGLYVKLASADCSVPPSPPLLIGSAHTAAAGLTAARRRT